MSTFRRSTLALCRWLRSLFGCAHRHLTFPQTRKERTYVACLDCGRELPYNWREMRIE